MNQNDIAYMAGLFDGEGHVEYKKRLVKQKKGKRTRTVTLDGIYGNEMKF